MRKTRIGIFKEADSGAGGLPADSWAQGDGGAGGRAGALQRGRAIGACSRTGIHLSDLPQPAR